MEIRRRAAEIKRQKAPLISRDKRFYKDFFQLLVFIALQNLIVYCVNLADNIMLGRWSEEALSGVALANQIQFLLQMIVSSVGEGVVVLASQYWGKKQLEPIPQINGIGLKLALATGGLFMLAGFLLPDKILSVMCNEAPVVAEGVKYMRIVCFSYLLYSASTVVLATMRSVENVHIGMNVSIMALFVNVILNYCLIFGRLGCPRLGVRGAALATTIARGMELAVALVFALKIDRKLRIKARELFAGSRAMTRDYIRVATPVILAGLSWGIAQFIQAAILGHLGSASVAANSIAASLFSIVSVVAYGSGSAAGVFIGKQVGAGNISRLKEYVRTLQILFLVIGLASGGLIFCLKDVIIGFYKVADGTRDLARSFMTVLSITVVGSAYQAPCLTGIVRGGGRTNFVFYNDLIFQWGIVLSVSLLGAFVWNFPPVWVFFCLKSDQLLKCAVAVVEVNSYRWIRKLTR